MFRLQTLGGFPQPQINFFPQLLHLLSLFPQAFDFFLMRLYLVPQALEKRPYILSLEFTTRRDAPRPRPPLKFVGKRKHRSFMA